MPVLPAGRVVVFLAVALAPVLARAQPATSGPPAAAPAPLSGSPPTPAPPAPLAPAPVVPASPGAASPEGEGDSDGDRLVLSAAGDIAYPNGWAGIEEVDERKEALFRFVRPIIEGSDLAFANIECPLTDAPATARKQFPIACKARRLEYITRAGFNLLSLANNHSADAGLQGISDTHALLGATSSAERPLYFAGTGQNPDEAGKPLVFTPRGKNRRVAFFAVARSSPGGLVASLDDAALRDRIRQARASADIVIVSVHSGLEYTHVPARGVVDTYHGLIDAGADLVLAHHPHVVQGVERYRSGVIFYSLGNFSFGSRTSRHLATGARMYSMIARITFRAGKLDEVELIPLYANNRWAWTLGDRTLEPRHATPQLLAGPFAQAMLDELEEFSHKVPTESTTRFHRAGDRLLVDLGQGPPGPEVLARVQHEQRHEYAVVILAGAEPRPATPAEKLVRGRGGTPDDLVPAAPAGR